jgi:hypothetical protein
MKDIDLQAFCAGLTGVLSKREFRGVTIICMKIASEADDMTLAEFCERIVNIDTQLTKGPKNDN